MSETEALLQRFFDVQHEREQAKSPQQRHAELRAVWQREHELLGELTALLDDAQRAALRSTPAAARARRGDRRR